MGWTFYNNGGEKIQSADTLDGYTSDDFVMVAGDTMTGALILSLASAGKNQLQISDTTFGAGLTVGGDTNLYRSAANTWKTDDSMRFGNIAHIDVANGKTRLFGTVPLEFQFDDDATTTEPGILVTQTIGGSVLQFGSPTSAANRANLYWGGADILKTDDSFHVGAAPALAMDAATGVLTLTDTEGSIVVSGGNAYINTRIGSHAQVSHNNLATVNTASGTTLATASISPAANRLILATVVSGRTAATPAAPTLSGNGLTWVQVDTETYHTIGTTRRRITVFRAMGSSPTTGALTASFAGVTQDAGITLSVAQFAGVDTSGTNGSGAVINSDTNRADAPSANSDFYVPHFVKLQSPKNAVYTAVAVEGTTLPSIPSEFTQIASHSGSATPGALHIMYNNESLGEYPTELPYMRDVSTAAAGISIQIKSGSVETNTLLSSNTTDGETFHVDFDGTMKWGTDTVLYEKSSSVLRTPNRFEIGELAPMSHSYRTQSSGLLLNVTDHFVGIQTDLSGGDVDVYLPDTNAGAVGKEYVITDIGNNANVNNINIWVQPGQSLNGVVAAGPHYVMNVPGETVRLFAYTQTGWWII